MKRIFWAIGVLMILSTSSFAADLSLGSDSKAPGETAIIPVTITSDLDQVNMVSFTINAGTTLATPTAVKGQDQSNILPEHCFVDDLGGGSCSVTAFVVSTPNIASGGGETIDLEFELTGVPEAVYPITVTTAQIFNIFNADVTGATSGGSVTVDESSRVEDWMLLN